MMTYLKNDEAATTLREAPANPRTETQLQALTAVKIFAFGLLTGVLLLKLDFDLAAKFTERSDPADSIHETGAHGPSQKPDKSNATRTSEGYTNDQRLTTGTGQAVAPDLSDPKTGNGNNVIFLTERVKSLEQRIQEQVDTARTEEAEKMVALREQLDHIAGERRVDQQTIAELNKVNNQLHEKIQRSQDTFSPSRQPVSTIAKAAPPPVIKIEPLQDGKTAYANGDYTEAVSTLKPLAEQGNATAQYLMGMMYRNGQGVLANNDTARAWMMKSARKGSRDAQMELAKFYTQGINGVTDPFLAYTWYLVAEKNGKYDFISVRAALEAKLQREMLTQAAALAAQLHNEEHDVSAAADVTYRSTTTNQ